MIVSTKTPKRSRLSENLDDTLSEITRVLHVPHEYTDEPDHDLTWGIRYRVISAHTGRIAVQGIFRGGETWGDGNSEHESRVHQLNVFDDVARDRTAHKVCQTLGDATWFPGTEPLILECLDDVARTLLLESVMA